ncbi:hypothetical protein M427DRAFT_54431 [Gonapodya prolifera JEL478]|uniref:Uncharacterized protein n=1 Tax=Gonapodya prolifera (strain JEL478) TaxID=1344416 RepID=A0A139AL29_GONPJ|nr:hypothetical protein M427DRAFT_54431 [Gonapodya prolifera JEL478]|eukprot:KXS17486.1 hypothetical protein M427DRAFT_54431 [Gonapodya prolifera JEL478]
MAQIFDSQIGSKNVVIRGFKGHVERMRYDRVRYLANAMELKRTVRQQNDTMSVYFAKKNADSATTRAPTGEGRTDAASVPAEQRRPSGSRTASRKSLTQQSSRKSINNQQRSASSRHGRELASRHESPDASAHAEPQETEERPRTSQKSLESVQRPDLPQRNPDDGATKSRPSSPWEEASQPELHSRPESQRELPTPSSKSRVNSALEAKSESQSHHSSRLTSARGD